jgi:hypothetical protein
MGISGLTKDKGAEIFGLTKNGGAGISELRMEEPGYSDLLKIEKLRYLN